MASGMSGPQGMQYQPQDASNIPNYSSPQQSTLSQPSSVGPGIRQQASSLQQKGPSSVPSALYTQHHPGGRFFFFFDSLESFGKS